MKIKTMVLALGLVASVSSFAQSADSAQNNTSSTATMTNPYTAGVNRYLSPNQITEVQNMIQGMILQNNTSINQQFSIRDQRDADIQNQINALRSTGSAGNAGCLIYGGSFVGYGHSGERLTVPHGTNLQVYKIGSYYQNNPSPSDLKICVNGVIVSR